MTRNFRPQHTILSILCLLIALSGMLSSCRPISETPESPESTDYELTPTVEDPATEVATATQTWTLTPEPLPTATATATETPIPTEVSLIEGNIYFDPQSEADFDKVAKSPSPIDEPEKFAAWQDEYLKMINEKLKTYDGPVIKDETRGLMRELGDITYRSEVWPVMASYKFEWQGKNILTKTYVVSSPRVGFLPFSVTYTTSDSPAFNQEVEYKTPTGEADMFIRYEWERAKDFVTDNFIDEYLPNRDENSDFVLWRNFMLGLSDSIEEDRYRAERTRFVFVNYQKTFN